MEAIRGFAKIYRTYSGMNKKLLTLISVKQKSNEDNHWRYSVSDKKSVEFEGNRHKLYKMPKPIRYTSSEPINYTLEPVNYTIVWNHLPTLKSLLKEYP